MEMLLVTLPMNTTTSTTMLMSMPTLTMPLMPVVPVREVAMMLPLTLDPLPLPVRDVSTRS